MGAPGARPGPFRARRSFGVVEVVEGADAQDGVELAALERKILGFALGQPDRAAGRAATAGVELGAGDVDADDLPVAGQPVEIDSVADSDVEQGGDRASWEDGARPDCVRGARRHCRAR